MTKESRITPSVKWLRLIFLAIVLFMAGYAVDTSLKSNMFALPACVTGEPWFAFAMVDFYFNLLILCLWVAYKETKLLAKILWIIAFITLGSIATCYYVLLQLWKLKPGDPITTILTKRI